jgi:hypothetical protein
LRFDFPAKPSDPAIFDRADRRVHSLFLEATSFHHSISNLISAMPSFSHQKLLAIVIERSALAVSEKILSWGHG